jgi:hypothetical protein
MGGKLNSVADFLKRTSERNGFTRERFEERRVPNDFSNITILPFFGDLMTQIRFYFQPVVVYESSNTFV